MFWFTVNTSPRDKFLLDTVLFPTVSNSQAEETTSSALAVTGRNKPARIKKPKYFLFMLSSFWQNTDCRPQQVQCLRQSNGLVSRTHVTRTEENTRTTCSRLQRDYSTDCLLSHGQIL